MKRYSNPTFILFCFLPCLLKIFIVNFFPSLFRLFKFRIYYDGQKGTHYCYKPITKLCYFFWALLLLANAFPELHPNLDWPLIFESAVPAN
jgi:hypothetical protein